MVYLPLYFLTLHALNVVANGISEAVEDVIRPILGSVGYLETDEEASETQEEVP